MYYVSLKQFEGPLDLLLHLITRAKVDIKDIFVSEITEQYLASMGSVDELDMDTASEFLTMAATLLEIKSRALLPRPPEPAEDGEETPEQTLIRRLEEYKLYKESAGRMKEFEQAAMQVFSKLPEEYPLPPPNIEITGLTLDKLVRAFERVLARAEAAASCPRLMRRRVASFSVWTPSSSHFSFHGAAPRIAIFSGSRQSGRVPTETPARSGRVQKISSIAASREAGP